MEWMGDVPEHRDVKRNGQLFTQRNQIDDWNGWIGFFLAAVVGQASANTKKTQDILALFERMKQDVPRVTRSQYVIQAIDALFGRPVFQSTDFIERSGIPKDSALRVLSELKRCGLG